MLVLETVIELLLPTWEEVQVAVAAAAIVLAAYWFFSLGGGGDEPTSVGGSAGGNADVINDQKEEIDQRKGELVSNSAYLIKVELLAPKNLTGANLNSTSDPYVIIACGTEKRFRSLNAYTGAYTRRRVLDKQGLKLLCQKHGPMQRIFNLPPDEVVEHTYSCALERSLLCHGRMYVSAWHICFHFNIFSKEMKVIIPFEDIDEIRRSHHALINPAITIILRVGAEALGGPSLGNADGRARYKFASFWNRNQALRALQQAAKNYSSMLEAEKESDQSSLLDLVEDEQPALFVAVREKQLSAIHADSKSFSERENECDISEESVAKPEKFQPFIKEEVLTRIFHDVFPCTAEQFFKLVLDDDSNFTNEYHTDRKDFDVRMGLWSGSDEYNGQLREVTYRSLCKFPMCPPDIPVMERQHAVLSADKKTLVFETAQQTEGVPFASYFEGHFRWVVETNSESSCTVDISFGAYFKKWCLLQSKIKATTIDDNKKAYKIKLDAARSYIMSRTSICRNQNIASPLVGSK